MATIAATSKQDAMTAIWRTAPSRCWTISLRPSIGRRELFGDLAASAVVSPCQQRDIGRSEWRPDIYYGRGLYPRLGIPGYWALARNTIFIGNTNPNPDPNKPET